MWLQYYPRKTGAESGSGTGLEQPPGVCVGPKMHPDPVDKPSLFEQWCPHTDSDRRGKNNPQMQLLRRTPLATALHTFAITLGVHLCQCNTENQLKCY